MPQWLEQVKKRVSDAVENPGDFAQMLVDQLRNYNAEVVPTAAGGELTNRPMTQDERNTKYLDLAQATGPGSLKNVSAIRDMLEPGSEAYRRVLAGEHPEKVFQDLQNKGVYDYHSKDVPGNTALRYETSRRTFEPGVVHYDASGGKQMLDIMGFPFVSPTGDELSASTAAKYLRDSRIRKADVSKIPEDRAEFLPYDPWTMVSPEDRVDLKGKHTFYVNEMEGGADDLSGVPTPKVRDIINDPALRKKYNMSLAVPSGSGFHRLAEILRSK